MIYFVEAPGRGIKVGFSNNVARRVGQLQGASPTKLKVIATIDGDLATEARIHSLLKDHRLNGEWFADAPAVRDLLRRLKVDREAVLGEMPSHKRDKATPTARLLSAKLVEMAAFYEETTLRHILGWEKPASPGRLNRLIRGVQEPSDHEVDDINFAFACYAVEKMEFNRKESRRLSDELSAFARSIQANPMSLTAKKLAAMDARIASATIEYSAATGRKSETGHSFQELE